MPKRYPSAISRSNSIYERPDKAALDIVANAISCDIKTARNVMSALVKGGYFIAPRNPTNHMLEAYIRSYGPLPTNPATMLTAVGKARKRWQAMGSAGTAMALSTKQLERKNNAPEESDGIDITGE